MRLRYAVVTKYFIISRFHLVANEMNKHERLSVVRDVYVLFYGSRSGYFITRTKRPKRC